MTGLSGWWARRRVRRTQQRKYGYLRSQQAALLSHLAHATDAHHRARLLLRLDDVTRRLSSLHDALHGIEWIPGEERSVPLSLLWQAGLFRALSDVEYAVAMGLPRRPAVSDIETAAGPVLDKMAATPDLPGRLLLLAELADAVVDTVGERAVSVLPIPAGVR